jgi:hypothetical protein
MINEKDVEILLANLSTGTETEFANLLFNFMQAGLVDKDRFRDIIIGARALAFDDGLDAAQEFAAQANQARRIQKARA